MMRNVPSTCTNAFTEMLLQLETRADAVFRCHKSVVSEWLVTQPHTVASTIKQTDIAQQALVYTLQSLSPNCSSAVRWYRS